MVSGLTVVRHQMQLPMVQALRTTLTRGICIHAQNFSGEIGPHEGCRQGLRDLPVWVRCRSQSGLWGALYAIARAT